MSTSQTSVGSFRARLGGRTGHEGVLFENHTIYSDSHPFGDNPRPRFHWHLGGQPQGQVIRDVVLQGRGGGARIAQPSRDSRDREILIDCHPPGASRWITVRDGDGATYDIWMFDAQALSRSQTSVVDDSPFLLPYKASIAVFDKGRNFDQRLSVPVNENSAEQSIHSGYNNRHPNLSLIEDHTFLANCDIFSDVSVTKRGSKIHWLLGNQSSCPERQDLYLSEPDAVRPSQQTAFLRHEWQDGRPTATEWKPPQTAGLQTDGPMKRTKVYQITQADGRVYSVCVMGACKTADDQSRPDRSRPDQSPAVQSPPDLPGYEKYTADAITLSFVGRQARDRSLPPGSSMYRIVPAPEHRPSVVASE